MDKCIYCGKTNISRRSKYALSISMKVRPDNPGDDKVFACCDDCYEKSKAYLGLYGKLKMAFGILCALSLLGILVFSAFIKDAVLTAVCMFVLSITVIVLPFGTPHSIKLYGIKRMKLLARVGGVLFAACGIITILFQ